MKGKMKVAIIHPLKHHAYSSFLGILKYNPESIALLGYYDQNDILDSILKKTRYADLVAGWHDDNISGNVKTNFGLKLLFLAYKKFPKHFKNIYFHAYEAWCIRHLKDIDCIYVLNNYCNRVIRYAVKNNIKIIYDQIIAFNYKSYYELNELNKDSYVFNAKQTEEIWNLKNASVILAPSQFVYESLMGYSFSREIEKNMTIIPYGGDSSQYSFKERHYNKGELLRLIFVGTVCRRKGLEYLIEAVKNTEANVQLTIIGSSSSYEGKVILDAIDGSNKIKYVGTVPHIKMRDYYNFNHVFCLPSLAEGSSLSTFEALSSGMPCIVSENAGSTITNGVEGFIVPCKSSTAIQKCIETLCDNPQLLNEMSNNAVINARKYTKVFFANKVSQLLSEINE